MAKKNTNNNSQDNMDDQVKLVRKVFKGEIVKEN